MAKKAPKKTPDKKPAKKPAAKSQTRPKGAAGHIDDVTAEAIWRFYAEGKAKREIARLVGVSEMTVRRRLAEDPERRVAIERSAAEERGKLYEEIENRGSKLILDVLGNLEKTLRHTNGSLRRSFKPNDLAFLDRAPRLLSALGGLSDKATKNAGGLAGASRTPEGDVRTPATENDKGDWTAEDLIQTAVTFQVEHRLPPWLRETAERMKKAGMLEVKQETQDVHDQAEA